MPAQFTDLLQGVWAAVMKGPGLLVVCFALDLLRYLITDLFVVAAELRERRRARRLPAAEVQAPPLVSVILAGHNEAATMPLTLASLREQSYPRLEIIVVDDGSTDGTAEAVKGMLAGGPPCRFVRLAQRNGKAGALNLGLLLSRGEIIVYVDADTTFDRDAVAEIVQPLREDPEVGAVGGCLLVRNAGDGVLAQVVALEYVLSIDVGRRFRSLCNLLHVISGAFGAFRRDLVVAAGGHTPTSGNDGDLTLKVRRLSPRLRFAHRALCLTKSPATLRGLIRQRRRWDRNLVKNKLRRHLDLLDPRSAGFRLDNAVLVLDAVLFNLVLGGRWLLALGGAALTAPAVLPGALALAYCLDLLLLSVQLVVAHWLRPQPLRVRLSRWLHLPLYPLYKIVFRLVRLHAYVEELISHASYRDAFAPARVSTEALGYDHGARFGPRGLVAGLLWPFRRR